MWASRCRSASSTPYMASLALARAPAPCVRCIAAAAAAASAAAHRFYSYHLRVHRCTPPSSALTTSFFSLADWNVLKKTADSSSDLSSVGEELASAKMMVSKLKMHQAKGALGQLGNKLEAFQTIPFSSEAHLQRYRDQYVESQLLLADVYGRTMMFQDAQKILESLGRSFRECGEHAPELITAENADTMATIQHKYLMCLFALSDDSALTSSVLTSILDSFSVFSRAADSNRVPIVQFYALLVRCYIFVQDLSAARQLLKQHLLQDGQDSIGSDMLCEWRRLEGQHCLAVLDFNDGDIVSVEQRLRDVRNRAKALLQKSPSDSEYQSNLIGLFATMSEKLCNVSFVHDRFDDAVALLREAIAEVSKLKGTHACMEVCRPKHTLAGIYHRLGQMSSLIEVANDLLQTCPRDNLEASSFFVNVADMVSSAPNGLDLSISLFKASLFTRNLFIPADQADIERARIEASFGAILNAKSLFEEALPLLQSALATFDEHFGQLHFNLAPILHHLGIALLRTNRPGDALEHLQRAMQLSEADDTQSVRAATIAGHMGEVLEALRRHDQAEKFIEKAVVLKREVMAGDPQLAVDLQNLASMKIRSRDFSEAIALYKEALEVVLGTYDGNHCATAYARRLLANALTADKQYAEACEVFALSIPVLENYLSVKQLIPSLQQYSQVLRATLQHDKAQILEQRVKAMVQQHVPTSTA